MSAATHATAAPAAPSPSQTRTQWTKTFANGDSYKGEALHVHDQTQKPIKDGKGRYTWASSGAVYDGEWKNGRPHGSGVMTVPGRDGYEYSGGFVDGLRCGHGRCSFANGRTYDGEWREDEMNGTGTVRGAAGVDDYTEYTGDFETGKRSGPHGRCVYVNGDIYEGAWRDGRRQGMGVWQLQRGAAASSASSSSSLHLMVTPVRYKGPFDKDQVHTAGAAEAEVTYSDGSSYVGQVDAQLRRHGRGVHRLADGDVFEGTFAQDQREGHGVWQGDDGMLCEGNWHRGQLNGEVSIRFAAVVRSSSRVDSAGRGETGASAAAATLLSDVYRLRDQGGRGSHAAVVSFHGPCTAGVLTGGPAAIVYADGSSYRGAVRHGLPHGPGTLRDCPYPYDLTPSTTAHDGGARKLISTACVPPDVVIVLLCYEGAFAAGVPEGSGVGEWRVSSPSSSSSGAVPRSASSQPVSRLTPATFADALAGEVVRRSWWPAAQYAVRDGTYRGQWLRGLPHGNGTWEWADGSTYEGEVRAYLPDGHGHYSSATVEYTGDFREGQPDGQGLMESSALGIAYEGEWRAGLPHGDSGVCSLLSDSGTPRSPSSVSSSSAAAAATLLSPSAAVYQGGWEHGRPSGQGRTFALLDRQRVVYDGSYVAGRREGQGTLYFGSLRRASGATTKGSEPAAVHAYAQYTGSFSNNVPGGGPGCLTLRNNTTVEGVFDATLRPCADTPITVRPHSEAWTFKGLYDSARHIGKGTMTFSNGDVYEGEVEDASAERVDDDGAAPTPDSQQQQQQQQQLVLYTLQRHGEGTYAFAEGNTLRCTWRHNILHGTGLYTAADGTRTERSYVDGVLTHDPTMLASVGVSSGPGSIGVGGSVGNVFTPENEFPNTLSEEALKARLPELEQQQQQQQQQQRKRQPFGFIKRGEARQASAVGATAVTSAAAAAAAGVGGAAPSTSPRKAPTDSGKTAAKTNPTKSNKVTPPSQSLATTPPPPQQKPAQSPRRGSSPSLPPGGAGSAATPVKGTSSSPAAATPPAASHSQKYSLRRPPAAGGGQQPASASRVSADATKRSGSVDTTRRSGGSRTAPQPANAVYLNSFQAGIRELDSEVRRSPSPGGGGDASLGTSPTAQHAAKAASAAVPRTTPAWPAGPMRRRLSSALAAARGELPEGDGVLPPQGPVNLQGSLKAMMTQACAIRDSREDEIHNLTEEMRQLNERIWQLRYVIQSDGKGSSAGAAPTAAPSASTPKRRLSKGGGAGVGGGGESAQSKTQRLAALIQERRVIMEKLQYIVNDPTE